VTEQAIGHQLRARRTAAGRTVASVAADAGLSVPYIANLENGRGNPTTSALTRLAAALGTRLVIGLVPAADGGAGPPSADLPLADVPSVPASLVRLGRSARFRRAARTVAVALDTDPEEFAPRLVAALASLAQAMGRDLAEPDWWRLLDAILLIAVYPVAPHHGAPHHGSPHPAGLG
jgi:transcriptional regulator with XRE-family HTH domain